MNTQNYKTKTQFIERENGSCKDTWPIALDIGYSSVKLFSPNTVAMFPSYARPFADKGTVGQLPKEYIRYTDLESGETWLVGQMAQENVTMNEVIDSDEALFGRQRYYDPMFKVITETALGIGLKKNRFGAPDGRQIIVQTGLPPKCTDNEDMEGLKDTIAGRHHFLLKIGSGAPVEFDFTIARNDVFIMLQPMGTLVSVSTDNDHNYTDMANEYFKKNVLIFDPGFGTFDLFELRNHSVKDSQTFFNLGMKQVLLDTIDLIRKKYGQTVTLSSMQKYLETGKIRVYDRKNLVSKEVPFDDLLKEASRNICMAAIDKTNQIYPLMEYDYLIITGGTGAAWETMIRDRLKGMETLRIVGGNQNDNLPLVFSNVRGYYQLRYNKLVRSGGVAS